MENGLGQQVTSGPACYMTCSGAPGEKCGGSWNLSLYQLTGTTKRSKNFGRHHQMRSRSHL